ncbi:MAG: YggT family protein [Parafilimonas terrae]|nr:YggT family protein [Parafilimonas terrae]
MHALATVILAVLDLYWWVIIATAIMSWLLAFDVINFRNDIVRSVWTFLNALTEPVLRPIRRFLPNLGGIDVSPIILLLVLMFVRQLIVDYVLRPSLYY